MPSAFQFFELTATVRKGCAALAVLMYAAILVLGSIPGARAEVGELASGLILHMLAYGAITLLLFIGIGLGRAHGAGRVLLAVALMGALDELLQSYLPYRSGALGDWAIDIGAAVLVLAGMMVWPRLRRRTNRPRASAARHR